MLTNFRVWHARPPTVPKPDVSDLVFRSQSHMQERLMILFDADYPRQGFEPPPALKRGDSVRVAQPVLNRKTIQRTSGLGSHVNNIRAGRLAARTGILD